MFNFNLKLCKKNIFKNLKLILKIMSVQRLTYRPVQIVYPSNSRADAT